MALFFVPACSDGDSDDKGRSADGAGAREEPGVPEPDAERPEPDSVVNFARALARDAEAATPRADLDPAVTEREVQYTLTWLDRLFPQRVMDRLDLGHARFRSVSRVGPKRDDAVLYSADLGIARVDIIDSRVLALLVAPSAEVNGVEAVFEQLVNYSYHDASGRVSFRSHEVSRSQTGRVGTIHVDRQPGGGWFAEPIVWADLPDGRYLFVVDKLVSLPSSKVPYPLERASAFVDGIRVNDAREYRRFGESNREDLARERFKQMQMQMRSQSPVTTERRKGTRAGQAESR